MDPDIAIVLGVVLFALAFPALLSAFSESRPPRLAIILLVAGAASLYWATTRRPGGVTLEDVPNAFVRVIAMVMH